MKKQVGIKKDLLEHHYKSIVIVLLLILFLQCFLSLKNVGLTNDELTHISSGYSYWKTGKFKMNPEHPPLIKLIATAPLQFIGFNMSFEDPHWTDSPRYVSGEEQWTFGRNFLFFSNNDADKIIFIARTPIIFITVLFGFFVFIWAKELFGIKSGLLALFLFSFSPNIIANGQLVTTDLGISFFLFLSVYCYWKYLKNPSFKMLLICGLAQGGAFSTKFTAVYLLPVLGVLGILHIYYTKRQSLIRDIFTGKILSEMNTRYFSRLSSLGLYVVFMCLIGLLVVCASYFFLDIGSFIFGFLDVIGHSTRGHYAYLLGNHSTQGWWYYFFVAFFLKTPIPTMVLVLMTLLFFRTLRVKVIDELFLVIPIIVFFSAFIFNHINIGIRHILPIYAFLFVFVSRIVRLEKRPYQWIILLLLLWYALGTLLVFPHYLTYFNEIAGGPSGGGRYLIDSNIDWGQDLGEAAQWIHERNISFVYLTYFGHDSPVYRGINYSVHDACGPVVGYEVISLNYLRGFTESQEYCSSWLWNYSSPVAIIGHTIYIYNISDEQLNKIMTLKTNECITLCTNKCVSNGKKYRESTISSENLNHCSCRCVE